MSRLGLLGILLPQVAFAYELTRTSEGVALRRVAPIVYQVRFSLDEPQGEALAAAARRAFDTWDGLSGGSLRPQWDGPATVLDHNDGITGIEVLSNWPAEREARVVAFADLRYDTRSGEIFEADVYLNGERFEFGTGAGVMDAQSVILHELGHGLGLAHTCGEQGQYPSCFGLPTQPPDLRDTILEAVMAPTLSSGKARRTPNMDDRAGLLALYTFGVEPPNLVPPELSCPQERLVFPEPLFYRYADGTETVADGFPAVDRGTVDLVSRRGAVSSLVAWTPPRCPPQAPQVPPEGCQNAPGTLAWALLLFRRRRL